MKKIILIVFLSCFFVCCRRPLMKSGLEGKLLPDLTLLSMDSTYVFPNAETKNSKPTVLVYFNPHCPYCKAQISDMIGSTARLKDIRIWLISDFSLVELRKFNKEYQFSLYPDINIGYDPKFSFVKYFRPSGVPYTAIYGKDQRLKGVYLGPAISHDIELAAQE